MNRRDLLLLLGAGVASASCAEQSLSLSGRPGRFTARPHPPAANGKPGLFPLHLGDSRDGLVYVPCSGTLPLVVLLHGAGGVASRVIEHYRDRADEFAFVILAPESRGATWDVIHGQFGDDIRFIDAALDRVFNQDSVDPHHIAIAGFSDGATYALSAGIGNGDLFTHIIAFSPGFAAPAAQIGRPRIFISHGTEDTILPIDRCSRRIVPNLRRAHYDVEYEEFRGPHIVPRDIAHRAFTWFEK